MKKTTHPNESVPQLSKTSHLKKFLGYATSLAGVGTIPNKPALLGGTTKVSWTKVPFSTRRESGTIRPMHTSSPVGLSRTLAAGIACLLTIAALVGTPLRAADVTWTNGSGSLNWNL